MEYAAATATALGIGTIAFTAVRSQLGPYAHRTALITAATATLLTALSASAAVYLIRTTP